MKLKLTDSFKRKIRLMLAEVILDSIDGQIEFPEKACSSLRSLADEIEQQNYRANNMQGLMSDLPEGLH